MDQFTQKHLEVWLEGEFNDQERDFPRTAMTRLYESDPAYWAAQGWTKIYFHAKLTEKTERKS